MADKGGIEGSAEAKPKRARRGQRAFVLICVAVCFAYADLLTSGLGCGSGSSGGGSDAAPDAPGKPPPEASMGMDASKAMDATDGKDSSKETDAANDNDASKEKDASEDQEHEAASGDDAADVTVGDSTLADSSLGDSTTLADSTADSSLGDSTTLADSPADSRSLDAAEERGLLADVGVIPLEAGSVACTGASDCIGDLICCLTSDVSGTLTSKCTAPVLTCTAGVYGGCPSGVTQLCHEVSECLCVDGGASCYYDNPIVLPDGGSGFLSSRNTCWSTP